MTKEQVAWESFRWILGWTIAYFCIGTWLLPHRWCLQLTGIYFLSLCTFSLGVIPAGYTGEYILRKKRRRPRWEEGYFLIPPFIPVFVFINGWIVGVRKVAPPEQMRQVRSDFFERIHHDTRDVRRVIHSNVSLPQNLLLGLVLKIMEWLSHGGDDGRLRFFPWPFLILIWMSYIGTTISYAITPTEEVLGLWFSVTKWLGIFQ